MEIASGRVSLTERGGNGVVRRGRQLGLWALTEIEDGTEENEEKSDDEADALLMN